MNHARLLAAAVLFALAACQPRSPVAAADPSAPAAEAVERIPLSIRTKRGTLRYRVEVARTPEEQAQGLMYRTSLPKDGGMLFPFADVRPASFWMKDTPLPLDIIFIRADGTIARIAAETVPYSLDLVDSGEPVAAVLELEGGAALAAGIEEGDRVAWTDSGGASPR